MTERWQPPAAATPSAQVVQRLGIDHGLLRVSHQLPDRRRISEGSCCVVALPAGGVCPVSNRLMRLRPYSTTAMSSTLESRRIEQLLSGVDGGLHDGVAPGGCHDQIHRSAKAACELFFEPEVGIHRLSGFERLELHQQVDVALTWAGIGAQQRIGLCLGILALHRAERLTTIYCGLCACIHQQICQLGMAIALSNLQQSLLFRKAAWTCIGSNCCIWVETLF